jgi:hypothetical protein
MRSPSFLSFCLPVCPSVQGCPLTSGRTVKETLSPTVYLLLDYGLVARQQLGKHVPTATSTLAALKELLDASFSMRSMSLPRTSFCIYVFLCLSLNRRVVTSTW